MKPAIDLARARADTPGVRTVLHFNNAGAALPPAAVTEAVIAHLRLEAEIGGYEAFDARQDAVEQVYDSVATLLNCARAEISLHDSATRAWDMAFYGCGLGAGDRILTSRSEYSSNFIAFLHRARRTGIRIDIVPDDEAGQLSVAALEGMIDESVRLIAITHIPTSGGLVNPAEAVGRIARAAGIPFLLDACQSCGQMPIDVAAIGCDMLSATGRKFLRGPRGTGILYVRDSFLDRLDPPFLDDQGATWTAPDRYVLREDARRFETWESGVAGRIGLGVAIDYALGWGLEPIAARIALLADRLRRALAEIRSVTLHDQGMRKSGIVTFSLRGVAADEIKQQLRARAINVTVSVREATLIDMSGRGLDRIVRASVHYYNSEDEVDAFTAALRTVAAQAA